MGEHAVEAVKRGFQPIPIVTGKRHPTLSGWTGVKWSVENLDEVREKFAEWARTGMGNLGVLLGEPSGNLVDVDLDHSSAVRLKEHFLPYTAMRSGRLTRPNTHYWYIAKDGTLPGTRQYKLSDNKTVVVELRTTGTQTVLPPSIHNEGDEYIWGGEPWGGDSGPEVVDGRVLQLQVAVLALAANLVDAWPGEGSRHSAYLALAGGLLRVGDGIHTYWERNAPALIGAIADATFDDDGPEQRVTEVMESTLRRIREGKPVAGFGKLGEIIGEDVVKHVRLLVGDVEQAAGLPPRSSGMLSVEKIAESVEAREKALQGDLSDENDGQGEIPSDEGFEPTDPLSERLGTWDEVNLDPYLTGQVEPVVPQYMERTDGEYLLYPGRVNMLFGPSEAAKSWIAMATCLQVIASGGRVMYLDFEDEPVNSLNRLQLLGAGIDDLRHNFTYVLPEEPLEPMERSRWGEAQPTEAGKLNQELFSRLLERVDPTFIVADGITDLYSLHGLDTNDTSHTSVITRWMKRLTRNGRATVLAIDHAPKNSQRGTMPIGSQHKVSMVQGALLQAHPLTQPSPGRVGEVELIVLKDRPGAVRAVGEQGGEKAQKVATVVIDSTAPGRTHLSIRPPVESPEAAREREEKVRVDLRASREAEEAARKKDLENRIIEMYGGEMGKGFPTRYIGETLYGSGFTENRKQMRELKSLLERLELNGWLRRTGSTRDREWVLEIGLSDLSDLP